MDDAKLKTKKSMPIEPGIYDNLDMVAYHADQALSRSDMVNLNKSGLEFDYQRKKTKIPTEAMDFGTAFHYAVLQPELFNKHVTVQSTAIKTRRGKDWDDFLAENPGKIILRREHAKYGWNILMGIMESIQRPQHTQARNILTHQGRKVEQSLFWQDADREIMLKARPDIYIPELACLADPKTTQNAEHYAFARVAYEKGYDIQAALYLNGVNALISESFYREFVFILFEVSEPHHIAVRLATQEMLDTGRAKIRLALDRYIEYMKLNYWPGYPDRVEPVQWPRWAML